MRDDTLARLTEPSAQPPAHPRARPRSIFHLLALAAGFYGIFIQAHGLLMTAQEFFRGIPPGALQRVSSTKGGTMMLLDNGREVVCPDHVLFHQPQRLQIHPGDRVAKARGSLTFTINGRNVTDFGWFVRKWLFPTHLWVLLLVCLSANAVAWLRQAHPRRTPSPVRALLVRPLLMWVSASLGVATAMQLMMWCVFAAFYPFIHHS